MVIAVLLVFGIAGCFVGRVIFGQWLNHITLYCAMWFGSVILFAFDFVYYYPIHYETWLILASALTAFFIGSLSVPASYYAVGRWPILSGRLTRFPSLEVDRKRVLTALWVTLALAMLAVAHLWYVELRLFGSVKRVLMFAEAIYHQRVEKGIPGDIPYITSLTLNAMFLAGVYTALTSRLTLPAVLSVVTVVLNEIAVMGRMRMINAGFLFFCGLVLTRRRIGRRQIGKPLSWLRRGVIVAATVALLVAGMEFVRITRGVVETFRSSKSTTQLYRKGFLTSSTLPLYVTVHFAVLDQYLFEDREHTMWGANSFFPLYRIMRKLGMELDLPPNYQYFYQTPNGANTGTYLREVHADFGISGFILYPFVLGVVTSWAFCNYLSKMSHLSIVASSWTMTLVMMCIFFVPTRAGDIITALIVAAPIAWWIDRTCLSMAISSNNEA